VEIVTMQRKQNLGMNAILSISLALARGVAHVRGQELWELLREEMLVIIARLAAAHGVAIQGSRVSGYLDALREVDARLEAQGASLHEALREVTGIYRPGSDSGMEGGSGPGCGCGHRAACTAADCLRRRPATVLLGRRAAQDRRAGPGAGGRLRPRGFGRQAWPGAAPIPGDDGLDGAALPDVRNREPPDVP
jgi:hypothetical protein